MSDVAGSSSRGRLPTNAGSSASSSRSSANNAASSEGEHPAFGSKVAVYPARHSARANFLQPVLQSRANSGLDRELAISGGATSSLVGSDDVQGEAGPSPAPRVVKARPGGLKTASDAGEGASPLTEKERRAPRSVSTVNDETSVLMPETPQRTAWRHEKSEPDRPPNPAGGSMKTKPGRDAGEDPSPLTAGQREKLGAVVAFLAAMAVRTGRYLVVDEEQAVSRAMDRILAKIRTPTDIARLDIRGEVEAVLREIG